MAQLLSLLIATLTTPLHYDEARIAATHNSYWARRSFELGASGSNERIFDQLAFEGVRALELDVHPRARQPGVWSVFHTNKESNSVCSPLTECLEAVRLFHHLEPRHDVINVIIELKALTGHAFDRDHSIAALDRSLVAAFGDALYRPKEFLARCPQRTTLRSCARDAGWPTMDQLRGRIIVNVLGNWRYDLDDWVDYATAASDIGERAAFPMRTILSRHGLTRVVSWLTPHHFDAAHWRAAIDASIFWQVGDANFAELPRFLREHGIVRSQFPSRGFQMLQTDAPWLYAMAPSRSAFIDSRSAHDQWQTAPTMSAHRDGVGCLEVASLEHDQSFKLCKRVLSGAFLSISTVARKDGVDFTRTFGAAGDLLSLTTDQQRGQSCVVAAAAIRVAQGSAPGWRILDRVCFSTPLPHQGLVASGHVAFTGTRHTSEESRHDDSDVEAKSRWSP